MTHGDSPSPPPPTRRSREWHRSGSLEALRDLLEVASTMREIVARRAGLGSRELTTLEHLSRSPVGPAELARRLDVTSAAATGIVDRLVARGHAVRRPHAVDRRRTEVHLTDSGRGEAVAHLQPMFEGLDELDRGFTVEERRTVERYLRGAIAALERVTRPSSAPTPTE